MAGVSEEDQRRGVDDEESVRHPPALGRPEAATSGRCHPGKDGRVPAVRTSTKRLVFPFSKADPLPMIQDPITELFVDEEAGREAFRTSFTRGAAARSMPSRCSSTTRTRRTCAISCCIG